MKVANKIHKILIRVTAQTYLGIAVLIFAASNRCNVNGDRFPRSLQRFSLL